MHGLINVKFVNAKQAKATHQYTNIKRKLYKTNSAIWYDKTCTVKQLTPNYTHIRINNHVLTLKVIMYIFTNNLLINYIITV
jgi:hypothetical protein